MQVTLRKYGNSTVAVLPPAVLKDLGIKAGQSMSLHTTADGKIMLSPKRKFRLADLLAQCDLKAAPPADLVLWENARSGSLVMAIFDRGDIVRVSLEPVRGREMRGESRRALVLTTSEFNRLGDVLVAPITQGGDYARFAGFAVSLTGTGCRTQGVALVNKIRMLDLSARNAKKVERVPREVIDDAIGRLITLFE